MTTISVPIPSFLEEFIKNMVRDGHAANKADVVRRALMKYREDEAVNAVLEAENDVREGRVVRGDLRTLVKKYKRLA